MMEVTIMHATNGWKLIKNNLNYNVWANYTEKGDICFSGFRKCKIMQINV